MKQIIETLLARSLEQLCAQAVISRLELPEIKLDRSKNAAHGDYASNIALILAKQAGLPPRQLAGQIIDNLPPSEVIAKAEVAGPGFINFFLNNGALLATVGRILKEGGDYGRSNIGLGTRVLIEFVSANPTGPLHVGHGRGAAYGSVLANLLSTVGFTVHKEYYVNDAGRQMDILAVSVWLRHLELGGVPITFPGNAYQGEYVIDIAKTLGRTGATAIPEVGELLARCADIPDPERAMDKLVAGAKEQLGDEGFRTILDHALASVLSTIVEDLRRFGVEFDSWFSERSLYEAGHVAANIEQLEQKQHLYRRDGARWFNCSAFGDTKDRVVVRENGQATYFASDIAYHAHKIDRGFDVLIDVWGADHHGYIPRVKAALRALDRDPARLEVLLVQFAVLYRGAEKMKMSTRAGEFVTLRELIDEVGADAARFFYVMRRCEQHLDFDLELAKSQSSDNPVYYVQYAHARVSSVMHQLSARGLTWDPALGNDNLGLLTESHEQALIARLAYFPELIARAATAREPHQLCGYLRELANDFHTYYNAHQLIVDAAPLRNARLNLSMATRQVLNNGLRILGVCAPEKM